MEVGPITSRITSGITSCASCMTFAAETALPQITDDARQFLESIGARTDFPSFAANVQSITGVSRDLEAQIHRLHEAIVQDVSLTAKILQISNTVAYNAGGSTITSVHQAILLLGFERVRHLALAATVFEHLTRKAPVVRELMSLSLITANQSFLLATRAGYPKPEVAYLCGMFNNIGEVLVACYRPRDYARWLAFLARSGRRGAGLERKTLGVTFDEISTALAIEWRMPREIVGTMRGNIASGSEDARALATVTRLSVELTNAIYRYDIAGTPGALNNILIKYARPLDLDEKVVREAAEIALADSKSTLDAVSASVDGMRLTAQIAVATQTFGEIATRSAARVQAGESADGTLHDDAHDESGHGSDIYGAATGLEDGEQHTEPQSREARTRDALSAMRAASGDGDEAEVGRVSRAALEAICGAGYRRALLALSTDDFARVRARLGAGEAYEGAMRDFLVRLNTGTSSLATAINSRTEIFTDAADWPEMRRDGLLRVLAPKSFGLLPLVHDDRLLGCLYFDDPVETVEASDELRELMRGLRDQLVAAFAAQRQKAER